MIANSGEACAAYTKRQDATRRRSWSPRTITKFVDEADNRFLECAEAARADFLGTGGKRHFPKR